MYKNLFEIKLNELLQFTYTECKNLLLRFRIVLILQRPNSVRTED